MSTWYNKVVGDLGSIVDSITYFENELQDARYECRIKGSLKSLVLPYLVLPSIVLINYKRLKQY